MPIVILLYEGYNFNFLMSMAHLIVTDFGAIKSANIEINIISLLDILLVEKVLLQNFLQYLTIRFFGLLKKEISIVS